MKHLRSYDPGILLDSIYNGIVAINSEGSIIFFNNTAEKIFGIPAESASSRYILDVLPNTGGKLIEALKTGHSFWGEKLKGDTVTLIANINPIRIEGRILGVTSVFQDISQLENISKELDVFKMMKNRLDVVIDSSYDGLWICDREGKIIRINPASEKLTNLKAENVVGKNVRDLISQGLYERSATLEVFRTRSSVTMIQDIKGGKRLLTTGNPVFDEHDEIAFVVANIRDVTELDRLRSQLQETEALAEGYITKISELEMKGVDLSSIVFKSEEMHRAIKMALRVSKVDSTVLISGESGVGKGMIAKLIHRGSNRSAGPFIRIDCAGVPESLFESELFGYEKGAFTGAKSEGKPGLFELANKGTLFLDEVGEIPLASQTKLLRFLEDHQVIRVGGTEPREINVRIIAATNRNIMEMVNSKLFRRDLFYRLNVVPISIPPLRERRSDILPLVFHYLDKFNKTHERKKILSPDVVDLLDKYDFPGNIRELANVVERLVVSTDEDRIVAAHLPSEIANCRLARLPLELEDDLSLRDSLRRYEKIIIEKAAKKHRSQGEIAKALKVDRATVSRKIRKYFSGKVSVQ